MIRKCKQYQDYVSFLFWHVGLVSGGINACIKCWNQISTLRSPDSRLESHFLPFPSEKTRMPFLHCALWLQTIVTCDVPVLTLFGVRFLMCTQTQARRIHMLQNILTVNQPLRKPLSRFLWRKLDDLLIYTLELGYVKPPRIPSNQQRFLQRKRMQSNFLMAK